MHVHSLTFLVFQGSQEVLIVTLALLLLPAFRNPSLPSVPAREPCSQAHSYIFFQATIVQEIFWLHPWFLLLASTSKKKKKKDSSSLPHPCSATPPTATPLPKTPHLGTLSGFLFSEALTMREEAKGRSPPPPTRHVCSELSADNLCWTCPFKIRPFCPPPALPPPPAGVTDSPASGALAPCCSRAGAACTGLWV